MGVLPLQMEAHVGLLEESRRDAHVLRSHSQAILIGSQTALIDKPRLDVRGISVLRQPLRVLIDSKGQVPPQGPLADPSIAPTWVFTSSQEHQKGWERCGARLLLRPRLDLKEILEELGEGGVIQVLIEGGSGLQSAFLKAGLVDQVIVYKGNCLLGELGKPFFSDLNIPHMGDAPRWTLENVRRFGNDVRLDFLPVEAFVH
jgi:diaminohydroxyphosphoribosylaminopyrimidine deaminase / 5-amino-6-(5-phosphoribosylamino)uracil reductase